MDLKGKKLRIKTVWNGKTSLLLLLLLLLKQQQKYIENRAEIEHKWKK